MAAGAFRDAILTHCKGEEPRCLAASRQQAPCARLTTLQAVTQARFGFGVHMLAAPAVRTVVFEEDVIAKSLSEDTRTSQGAAFRAGYKEKE